MVYTWWFTPLSKWVIITLVISGLAPLIPFTTRVITHLLSGMNHQVGDISIVSGFVKQQTSLGGQHLVGSVAKPTNSGGVC